MRACLALLLLAGSAVIRIPHAAAAPSRNAAIEWQAVGSFEIARTETTIGQYRRFVEATGMVTLAERMGGGEVYELGWVRKPGWHWRAPFGPRRPAGDAEPAVHITYDEAQAFCVWAGARLPTDAEWASAAYTEQRPAPPAPFVRGRTYAYPTGYSPKGAQCLDDCGTEAGSRATAADAGLLRGHGPARVTDTPAGVNGLHDMGGNAWEWADEPRGQRGQRGNIERRTRGGSWWYGAEPMRAGFLQSKPGDTTAVYIGFRCLRAAA